MLTPLTRYRFTPTCVGTMFPGPVLEGFPSGSPPRAWGQSDIGGDGPHVIRFPPTCVGTMPGAEPPPPGRRVHPHVRGDNGGNVLDSPSLEPVHPHVRGDNVCPGPEITARLRFTPTCVGTMWESRWQVPFETVHPHVRGDNFGARKLEPLARGSPPRAWGQFVGALARRAAARFTPTCVGTMKVPTAVLNSSSGSPPRAWGQCDTSCTHVPQGAVHPHVRGDNCVR